MGLLGTMSAVGTALGPTLGGVLISGLGWRAVFLITVPLGAIALLLARRSLPAGPARQKADRPGFDSVGTLLLALTLAAYALAMTIGRDSFGWLNVGLLLAAALGVGLFVLVEAKTASPLIGLEMFRNPVLSAGMAASVLVLTVAMATLVVGPFYLSQALGLDPAMVGLVMSSGPIFSALSGIPAGRLVDRLGAPFMSTAGLLAMAAGSLALCMLPMAFGIAGYVAALAILTPGYQLFQAANNTTVMTGVQPDQRGVVSGLLNLSRNLGGITGASAMGAVFAFAAGAVDIAAAHPADVTIGMRVTFAVAAALIVVALAVSVGGRALAPRHVRDFRA
jgi:MFS family permease